MSTSPAKRSSLFAIFENDPTFERIWTQYAEHRAVICTYIVRQLHPELKDPEVEDRALQYMDLTDNDLETLVRQTRCPHLRVNWTADREYGTTFCGLCNKDITSQMADLLHAQGIEPDGFTPTHEA